MQKRRRWSLPVLLAAVLGPAGSVRSCGCGAFYGMTQTEIFDPATARWSEGPETQFGHDQASLVELDGDDVLVLGGFESTCGDEGTGCPYGVAERIDVGDGSVHALAMLPEPIEVRLAQRTGSQVRVYTDGASWLYSIDADTWERAAAIGVPSLQMIALADGRVLVIERPSAAMQATWVYDPVTATRYPAGNLGLPREDFAATLLADGRVLLAGGLGPANQITANAELFDPATLTWSTTTAMSSPRMEHAIALLPDGRVLVTGGRDGSLDDNHQRGPVASAEIYDPASAQWSAAPAMRHARWNHRATVLRDGRTLVTGGERGWDDVVAETETFDPVSTTWVDSGDLAVARFDHSALVLDDGRTIVVGGRSY